MWQWTLPAPSSFNPAGLSSNVLAQFGQSVPNVLCLDFSQCFHSISSGRGVALAFMDKLVGNTHTHTHRHECVLHVPQIRVCVGSYLPWQIKLDLFNYLDQQLTPKTTDDSPIYHKARITLRIARIPTVIAWLNGKLEIENNFQLGKLGKVPKTTYFLPFVKFSWPINLRQFDYANVQRCQLTEDSIISGTSNTACNFNELQLNNLINKIYLQLPAEIIMTTNC